MKLKPCPFCGKQKCQTGSNKFRVWMLCLGCGAEGPPKMNLSESVDAWNSRSGWIEIEWKNKPSTIDEACGQPAGTFEKFIKWTEARNLREEKAFKRRMSTKRKGNHA